jgi:hypothetical protein
MLGRRNDMQRVLITFGTLAGGTALAFALAALAFMAAPDGRLVPGDMGFGGLPAWQGVGVERAPLVVPLKVAPMPMPMPMPAVDGVVDPTLDVKLDGAIDLLPVDAGQAPAWAEPQRKIQLSQP